MPAYFVIKWIDLLSSRGGHFNRGKGIRIVIALIEGLKSDNFPSQKCPAIEPNQETANDPSYLNKIDGNGKIRKSE